MNLEEIARLRLIYQHISRPVFSRPAEVAAWLGAVQGQDYGAAQWALGLRTVGGSRAGVEQAIAERSIVRTWALRGTLHIAAAEDIRWMLGLAEPATAPRLVPYHRQLELDEDTFARSHAALAKALQGGQALTRKETAAVLEASGVSTQGLRMTFLLYRAALEGLICLGVPRGKQPTFVLLEEWLPPAAPKPHDEGLAELAWRFFRSHGPAMLKDFGWWSGLPAGEARAGLELVKTRLVQESCDGQVYWMTAERPAEESPAPTAALLPIFDEYLVGYSERSAVLDTPSVIQVVGERGMLGPFMVIDGKVAGTWKRTISKGGVSIALQPFGALNAVEEQAVTAAAQRYAQFLGMERK